MASPLRDRASGRWRDLLTHFGVDSRFLSPRHGPCPFCGGKDRFRWDNTDGSGSFYCSACGAGDGIEFVMRIKRVGFPEAARMIEDVVGTTRFEKPKAKLSSNLRRKRLNDLWAQGKLTVRTDPVGLYLRRRGVGLEVYPPVMRTVPSLEYRDDGQVLGSWPALVAMVMEPAPNRAARLEMEANGEVWGYKPVTMHRTWVGQDGLKAPVADPRRIMPGDVPAGAFIPLFDPENVIGIAEGLETALAATRLFGIKTWSAINAHNLEHFNPPPGTTHCVVFSDNDASYTGQAAAYALAKRLTLQEQISTTVEVPEESDTDWNDVLEAQLRAKGTVVRLHSPLCA